MLNGTQGSDWKPSTAGHSRSTVGILHQSHGKSVWCAAHPPTQADWLSPDSRTHGRHGWESSAGPLGPFDLLMTPQGAVLEFILKCLCWDEETSLCPLDAFFFTRTKDGPPCTAHDYSLRFQGNGRSSFLGSSPPPRSTPMWGCSSESL